MMPHDMVPFGKYKGQPVEVLQQDQAYCEWLAGQDWLQTRFPQLHTVIINNFAEPSETPEHNALQTRFLDNSIKAAVLSRVGGVSFPKINAEETAKNVPVAFESWGADVVLNKEGASVDFSVYRGDDPLFTHLHSMRISELEYNLKDAIKILRSEELDIIKYEDPEYRSHWGEKRDSLILEHRNNIVNISNNVLSLKTELEKAGYMVVCYASRSITPIAIELKPTMGDDYPSVLRQVLAVKRPSNMVCRSSYEKEMKVRLESNFHRVLVVGRYTGTGATLDQVREIFRSSGIYMFMFGEIEAVASSLSTQEDEPSATTSPPNPDYWEDWPNPPKSQSTAT
jgi:hypothetical protein